MGDLLGGIGGAKPQFPLGPQPHGPIITVPGMGDGTTLPNSPLPGAPNSGLPGGNDGLHLGNNSPSPTPSSPLLNPDNPASRLLQGQSPLSNSNNSSSFNSSSPTQYPAPTLSERALNNAAHNAAQNTQYAQLDRPVSLGVVTPTAGAQSANVAGPIVPQAAHGAASGAAAGSAAAAANTSGVPMPTLTLVASNTTVSIPAAPMASGLSQDALTAQQALFTRLNNLQHAATPPGTNATAAPPPSETSATLPAVNTNTIANDPRSLPLTANDRAAQQRGGENQPNLIAYTGDGAPRRTQRRGGVDNATLSYWLSSFGRGGVHRPTHDNEPDLEVIRALQWLFWVLTVVAYGCLAMAVILLLPGGSLVSERVSTAGSGVSLFLGVVVAAGAWWLGRHLNRRRTESDSDAS